MRIAIQSLARQACTVQGRTTATRCTYRTLTCKSLPASPQYCAHGKTLSKPSPRTQNPTSSRHELQQQQQRRDLATTAVTEAISPKVLINDLASQEVVVDFNNGTATRYPSFWLRDHCPCSTCTHPQTRQRQLDTFSLDPDNTKAFSAEARPEGLRITWSGPPDNHDRHESLYPWSWLEMHVPFTASPVPVNPRGKNVQYVSPAGPYPTVDYHQAMETDEGLAVLLDQIRTYGLAFVTSSPVTLQGTEALAERIAFVRRTHYGGFWEVISEAKPVDTAYTNLYLPNHTDTTYFTDPCGLQMFHCLSHTSSASKSAADIIGQMESGLGGESTFVDGFAAAAKLYSLNPDYYKYLSNVRIVSHASGDDEAGSMFNNAVYSSGFPILSHINGTAATPHPKHLSMVRWNNSDRHSSTSFPSHHSMKTWYAAARIWNELVQSPEFEITVKLTPGSIVVFDNWRILHGRKAFEGVRRLCGAYIGMDDFLAKGRAVNERLGKTDVSIET